MHVELLAEKTEAKGAGESIQGNSMDGAREEGWVSGSVDPVGVGKVSAQLRDSKGAGDRDATGENVRWTANRQFLLIYKF